VLSLPMKIRLSIDIPTPASNYAYLRVYFDGSTFSGTWIGTPEEAGILARLLVLGARDVPDLSLDVKETIHPWEMEARHECEEAIESHVRTGSGSREVGGRIAIDPGWWTGGGGAGDESDGGVASAIPEDCNDRG